MEMLTAGSRRLVVRYGLPFLLSLSVPITAFSAVGHTSGFANVSSHGSAQYSIPLWVPKGVGALTPRLAITYDHRTENGLLGVGWSVTGLSSISRCARTISQDLTRAPVNVYDPGLTDRFCLDGNRLRLTSTGIAYGATNSTYQTEIDTVARVTAKDTLGTGPQWFKVEGKDGLTYEYGRSATSRSIPLGYTEAQSWALSKVLDRSGNILTIAYTQENGSLRPDVITYTGRDGGAAGPYTVQFVYDAVLRPDPIQGYAGAAPGVSGLVRQDRRLARIEMRENGTVVRQYELTYELGIGGLSRLKYVKECAASLTDCLERTTLDWHDGVSGFTQNTLSGSTYPQTAAFLYTVDLNADGREDLLWYVSGSWKFAFGQADGLLGPVTNGPSVGRQWSMPIEWDGDGRTDLLYAASNTFWVLRSNGSGFDTPAISTGIAFNTSDDFWAADLDGDGRDDFIRVNRSPPQGGAGIFARLRRGTTFGAEALAFSGAGGFYWFFGGFREPDGYMTSHVRRPDFDGDGRMDLMIQGCQQYEIEEGTCIGDTGWFVFYSRVPATANTVSFGQIQIGQYLVNSGGLNAIRPVLGDFNADGKTDLVYAGVSHWYLYESHGGGQSAIQGPSISGFASFSARVTDYDGDGYSDLLAYNGANGGTQLMRSNGHQLEPPVPAGITGPSPFIVIDTAGDGLADLFYSVPGTSYVWKHNVGAPGSFPNLLRRATDGFGVYAEFTYRPMTDASVYTKGTGATYPVIDYAGSRQLVSQLTLTDGSGNGSTFNISRTYESAQLDLAGRGFLGFGKVVSVDGSGGHNQRTEEVFRLDFPYVGAPVSRVLRQSSGTAIQEVTNTWNTVAAGSGETKRDFPYVSSSIVEFSEAGGAYNGTDYATVQRTVNAIDAYGTITDITTTTTEVATGINAGTVKSERVYHSAVKNDTTNWCLGRPETTQFINTHTVGVGASGTRTVEREWDGAKCRITAEHVEPGNLDWEATSTFSYEDAFENLTKVTVSGVGVGPRETRFGWGTRGQFPETITNALMQQTTIEYRYDLGLVTSVTDPNGIETEFGYDTFGRRTLENRSDDTSTVWSLSACSSCGDARARYKVTETHRDTAAAPIRTNEQYFDQFDRSIYRDEQQLSGALTVLGNVQFDARGRPTRVYVPYWSGLAHNGYQQLTYDQLNRVTAEALYTGGGALDRSSAVEYNGLSVTATDPLSNSTTRSVSPWGELARVTDAVNSHTNYQYDAFGLLKEVRDAYGTLTSSIDYNIRGMKTSQFDRYLGNWVFTPNALGEVTGQTDANGKVTSFAHDVLGRITAMTLPEGISGLITSEFHWGSNAAAHNIGQLEYQRISGTGLATYREDYTYDASGRLLRTDYQEGANTFAVELDFDEVSGLLDTLTYPVSTSGYRLKLKYDYQFGHLLRVKDVNPPATVFWQANSTDALGQVIDESLGNGIQTLRGFDPLTGLLEYIQSGPGGTAAVQNLTYQWNTAGSLTERKDVTQNLTEHFYYDSLHRLDYSTLDGVTNLDLAYDAIGNITERVSAATASYSAGHSMSWYANNMPKTITGGSSSSTFFYTPSGARLRQNAMYGATSESTLYIGGVFERMTRGSLTEHRHYIPTGSDTTVLYTRRSDGTASTYYVTKDHRGSPSAVTSINGAVLAQQSFGAWGERRGANWQGNPSTADWMQITATMRHGFTGHEHLDNLALIHMNGRVYDAYVGRFVSPDPFVQAPHNGQSYNRYAYAFNNPLSLVDPSGFAATDGDEPTWPSPPPRRNPPEPREGPTLEFPWWWGSSFPPARPEMPDPQVQETPVGTQTLSQQQSSADESSPRRKTAPIIVLDPYGRGICLGAENCLNFRDGFGRSDVQALTVMASFAAPQTRARSVVVAVADAGTLAATRITASARGTATVIEHAGRHASIVVNSGNTAVHTEQLLLAGRQTTIAVVEDAAASVRTFTVELPDAAAAVRYQQSVIGQPTGVYDVATNSCVTHCGDVLRAGGLEVPETTREIVKWLNSLGN